MTRRATNARRAPAPLGTVETLPSGRWRAFYRRDGRKFTAPHTFATKAEGQAWIAIENADRARGVWRDPAEGRVSLEAFATAWLDARPDLRPRTVDLYRRVLDRWVLPRVGVDARGGSRGVALGGMDIAAITPAVVRTWYAAVRTEATASANARSPKAKGHPARAWARENGLHAADTGRIRPAVLAAWERAGSPTPPPLPPRDDAGRTTAAQAYRLLHTIMGTAVHDGTLAATPCRIRNAGNVNHRERPVASLAELGALAHHMPPRLAAAVTVAAWSGLRYGELFALSRHHVPNDGRSLRVERAVESVPGKPLSFGAPKTANSRRTVHLPGAVAAALVEHMVRFTPDEADALVFSTQSGKLDP